MAGQKRDLMDTPWAIIGWIVLACIILFSGIMFTSIAKVFVSQWLTDWRRKRAHAGKVPCEGYDTELVIDGLRKKIECEKIATRVTPNGYFCEDHWSENSRKIGMYAGISYGHLLNHAMKERRD